MAVKKEIQHDRPNCIGCAACAAVNPKDWVMNQDGKSDLVKSEDFNGNWQRREISEEEFKDNLDAAESCPVNVIHILEKEVDNSGKVVNEKKIK